MLLSVDGTKSGKPSWLGDSGMFSRKGVEPPLVGGPHGFGVKPSCAWISLALRKASVRLQEARYRFDPHRSLTALSTTVHQVHVKESQLPIVHYSMRAPNSPARSYFQKVISSCCPTEAQPGSLLRSKDQTGNCGETVAEGS